MRSYLKIFLSVILLIPFISIPAPAEDTPPAAATTPPPPSHSSYYNYANDEAEYSVMLPEAPTVKTIWEKSAETTPYLEDPPDDSTALGEVATFKRVDIDTEEMFDVKITFLKAKRIFLDQLTKEKIKKMLDRQYKDEPLTNEQYTFSAGTKTLKWATLSGFTLDAHQHPAFCATHYLTGLQSILVVQVKYSIENKTFQDYYNTLVNSITYSPP